MMLGKIATKRAKSYKRPDLGASRSLIKEGRFCKLAKCHNKKIGCPLLKIKR